LTDVKKQPLIPERVILVGNGEIAQEDVELMTDHQMQVFLREPDPSLWPGEMTHLVRYLSGEERVRSMVPEIMADRIGPIRESLERAAIEVWRELTVTRGFGHESSQVIIHEMAKCMERLFTECIREIGPRRL
jgi:hypothetical protein